MDGQMGGGDDDVGLYGVGGGRGGGRGGGGDETVTNENALPDVDGSVLEGGGQVLRVTLGVGAVLQRPLHIHSIRGRRPSPGKEGVKETTLSR